MFERVVVMDILRCISKSVGRVDTVQLHRCVYSFRLYRIVKPLCVSCDLFSLVHWFSTVGQG